MNPGRARVRRVELRRFEVFDSGVEGVGEVEVDVLVVKVDVEMVVIVVEGSLLMLVEVEIGTTVLKPGRTVVKIASRGGEMEARMEISCLISERGWELGGWVA